MWSSLNGVSNALFGALLGPAQLLPGWLAGALLGALAALLSLLVFRHTSGQAGIERIRARMQAHFRELRLSGGDLRLALRSLGHLLRDQLAYLTRAALPALLLGGPFTLALIQLESRFALRPLAAGEHAALRVELDAGIAASELAVEIRVPRGLTLETPALRKDPAHEIVWRVRAELPGRYLVMIQVGGQEYERRLLVGAPRFALARRVCASGQMATLLRAERTRPAERGSGALHRGRLSHARGRARPLDGGMVLSGNLSRVRFRLAPSLRSTALSVLTRGRGRARIAPR